MAFRDFFRGDRERDEEERNRERWRQMSGEWRDEGRGGRDQGEEYSASERDYRGRDQGYGAEHGWSPGSEYYNERSQSYRGGEDYGRYGQERSGRAGYGEISQSSGGYGSGAGRNWRDEDRNYGGDYGNRGSGSSVYGRYYGGGASAYTGSGYGRSYGRGAGEAYGEGGYGRDIEQGRRGAMGYGGYGGMGGAETGSGGGSMRTWGQGSEGQHRGKGPRGYRRSDERIREEVCDCLTDDPRIDASNLEVTVKDCEVTLSGSVNSREEKRRAEDLIERLSGVKDVTNNLRVTQQAQTGENIASPSARH